MKKKKMIVSFLGFRFFLALHLSNSNGGLSSLVSEGLQGMIERVEGGGRRVSVNRPREILMLAAIYVEALSPINFARFLDRTSSATAAALPCLPLLSTCGLNLAGFGTFV